MNSRLFLIVSICLLSVCFQQGLSSNPQSAPSPRRGWQQFSRSVKYPELANRAGLEGFVLLTVIIDSIGNARSASVRLSTDRIFDDAAIQSVRASKWIPPVVKGHRVGKEFQLPFLFTLDSAVTCGPITVHGVGGRSRFVFNTLRQEKLAAAQRARRDSAERAFNAKLPVFRFHFILDGNPVFPDSNSRFGLYRYPEDTLKPVVQGGDSVVFQMLPDTTFAAYLSVSGYSHEFNATSVTHGADIAFRAETRKAEIVRLKHEYNRLRRPPESRMREDETDGVFWEVTYTPRSFGRQLIGWTIAEFVPTN